ncbi:MAG: HlyD family efflux transporter periplasmic adaptor subunit [Gudongella sp.]|nr:HlyD family efflux transporter periplasmic adaptor subunit [Gudongella sp.]
MNKKKIIIIGIIVIIVLAVIYFFVSGSNKGIEVSVIEVEESDIIKTIEMSGSVYASDNQEILIPAGINVNEVYIQENDFVNRGDVLAVLDTADLNLKLEKAQITLTQIDADIQNPESKLGSDSGILSNNIDKASESYKKAESDLALAKEKLDDLKVLYDNGAISESELKNQISLVSDLEIGLRTANLNIKDAKLRYSDYFSQTSDTKSDLARQRQTTLLDIEGIKDTIEDSVIRSQISGVVTNFELKKDRETSSNELVKIQDPDSFKFEAMVPQEDAILIEKDQKAQISIAGLTGNYDGVVSSKAKTASIDQSSGSSTPKVKIAIDILKEDNSFVSGFDADALVETGLVEKTLALNNEAIKKDDEGNYFVYLVDSNNKAKKTIIEVGLSDGYKTQIISGLKINGKVVSNPPAELKDGSDLKIK